MLPFQDRYSRQRKLPEVGKLGQARIEALRVVVRGGPEASVEVAYLERAGVGQITLEPGPVDEQPDWPHGIHFTHAGAANVARGAWSALQRLQRALREAGPNVDTSVPLHNDSRDPA